MAVAIFLFVDASPGWSQQQYFYSPNTVETEGNAQGKDGVLVQEVSVQKGDTLYGISRKFSGHGSYYPQILLFNEIKNPNKIYPGDVFKIPVSRNVVPVQVDKSPVKNGKVAVPSGDVAVPGSVNAASLQKQVPAVTSAVPAADVSTHDLKKVDTGGEKKRAIREKVAGSSKKQIAGEKQQTTAASGQKLFENAVKAYRQDDYKKALDLFDRYLSENQSSPLAADASLYKAECYLKLSSQN
jgi:LysM repeat protein